MVGIPQSRWAAYIPALKDGLYAVFGNELGVGRLPIVGQQDRRFFVTQVADEQLAQSRAGELDLLLKKRPRTS